MKEQLTRIMEAEGMTPAKFADEIGVQRSSISHIISGRNKPSYDFIVKILNRFNGINAEWLITGKGSMIKSAQEGDIEKNMQTSLFQQEKVNSEDNSINYDDNEITSQKVINKQNKEYKKHYNSSVKNDEKIMFTNVNNVKYILVFYSDGSFEQFTPRESKK